MEGEAMIFDPSQKKKKKSKSKKAFDLDKALEQTDAPAANEVAATADSAPDAPADMEVTKETPTEANSSEVPIAMNMFSGKKKKSHKALDMSKLEAELDGIDPAAPADAAPPVSAPPTEKKKTSSVAFDITTNIAQAAPTVDKPAGRDTVYDKDNYDGTDRDYTYDELLTRVFNIMKEKNPSMVSGERKKFVMKPPQVSKLGTKKTAFANFADICKALHRQPKHLLQYLLAELGTSGSVDGNSSLIIKGRFQQKQIENVLRSYIKEYVTCHTCKSPETKLERDTRLFFLQCSQCGSRCSVSSIQSGFKAVVGKRAVLRRKVQ